MESKLEIRCGKSTDSYERLMELCRNEANKVVTELQNADSMKVEIEFWTDEQPVEKPVEDVETVQPEETEQMPVDTQAPSVDESGSSVNESGSPVDESGLSVDESVDDIMPVQ